MFVWKEIFGTIHCINDNHQEAKLTLYNKFSGKKFVASYSGGKDSGVAIY